MSLRIRQIVVTARDLATTASQIERVLGVQVCYRDPEVGKFGLENALFTLGDQFLEIVSPVRDNTAAGRHIERHGDSGYMLILQTDDLARDRARLDRLGVRIVWQATHSDVSAVHLHPKDIGAAIVSIDQPIPPESWRWAGPNWQKFAARDGAQRVLEVTIGATDPAAMAQRWAEVLGTSAPTKNRDGLRIDITDGALNFVPAKADVIAGFGIAMNEPQNAFAAARARGLDLAEGAVTICGTHFAISRGSV